MKQSYSELLLDPRWQKKKSEIMQRDNFTCQMCGCKSKTLHVHHKYYDGRNPWEYEDDALITLCEDCHNKEHDKTIPKFGEVYVKDDGDYNEYMVCYGNNNKSVFLLGINEVFGFYSICISSVDIKMFKTEYKLCEGFWNKIYDTDEGYYAQVLAHMLACVYNYSSFTKNDYSYYVDGFKYEDCKVILYAKAKIWSLVNTNDSLFSFFRDIIC